MDINTLIKNGYDFLMDSAYQRITTGHTLSPNGEPYTYELLENMRKHFENKEDYSKCITIRNKRNSLFNHINNYVLS